MTNAIEWVPVGGYEGRYEITRCGRIRSLARTVYRKRGAAIDVIPVRAKELRPCGGPNKYSTVELAGPNGRRRLFMHRLLAQAFIPNPEGLPMVNHIDGNKANNDLSNLEWCTPAQNAAHASRTGLLPKGRIGPGEKSPAAKLTQSQVAEIRRRVKKGETQRSVAAFFGISYGNVSLIVRGKTWATENGVRCAA